MYFPWKSFSKLFRSAHGHSYNPEAHHMPAPHRINLLIIPFAFRIFRVFVWSIHSPFSPHHFKGRHNHRRQGRQGKGKPAGRLGQA
jgi:hypothetical protein